MAVAAKLGMAYGNFQLLVNVVLLVVQVAFGRKFLDRYGCECGVPGLYLYVFFIIFLRVLWGLELVAMPVRLVALCVGVAIICLGLSMYQMPDEGVAPYDSLSLIMTDKWPKIPYFWHRMSNDVVCALICYFAGGVIGIGTLVTAFGLGPVIHFFNRHFTGKLLAWVDGE